MATKTKKFKIIPNPRFEHALHGYQPIFGNHEDRAIAERYEAFQKALEKVDNKVLRAGGDELTKKMRDLLREETNLIWAITKRNMDF